ncbi:MAG: hypothetical protein IK117_07425, partial [Bacteroidales bacterium]|nr:hypothetical protein [Bacteroidales bacterium]
MKKVTAFQEKNVSLQKKSMKWFVFFFLLIVSNVSCMSDSKIVINYPVFERTDVPHLRINKVEVTMDTTYLYCTYTAEAGSWASISKDTYLFSHDTQERFNIINSNGIPFEPAKRHFAFQEQSDAIFCFPSIKGLKKLDFIEAPNEQAFNIYGIDLDSCFEKSYNESDYKRFSNLASFYDTANDTLKALQYKKEENEAAKFIYGNESEEFILSLLYMSIMYDKYDLHDDAIKNMLHFSNLFGKTLGTNNCDYAMQLRTLDQF